MRRRSSTTARSRRSSAGRFRRSPAYEAPRPSSCPCRSIARRRTCPARATARANCCWRRRRSNCGTRSSASTSTSRGIVTLPEMDLSTAPRWRPRSAEIEAGPPATCSTAASSSSRWAASIRSRRRSSRLPPRGTPGCRVLQIDAHADLRDVYQSQRHSHACAMRRTLDFAPLVQVGIRNISDEEARGPAVARDDDLLRLEHARRRRAGSTGSLTRSPTPCTSRSISTAWIPATMPAVGRPSRAACHGGN